MTSDTRSLCVWKAKAKKENRAKRLRKKIAKAALLVEARHRLRRLAEARYHRVRLAELEVEVLELRATNLALRSKRSRDDVAPDSTSKRQRVEPADSSEIVREAGAIALESAEPVPVPTASAPPAMPCEPDASTSDQRRDPCEDSSKSGEEVPVRRQILWPDSLLDTMLRMRFTDPLIASSIDSASSKQKSAAWKLLAVRVSEGASMRYSERQLRSKFAKVKWEYKHWSNADTDHQASHMTILRRWVAG
jgi:hypothetical protein